MQNPKTPIHITQVNNEIIKMIKTDEQFKNADDVLSLLIENFNPELIVRAEQIIKLRRGE